MTDPGGPSLYERVGGSPWFEALVRRFYEAVATDPVLRPLYPGEDLGDASQRLTGFLIQYWGGPAHYSAARGHPRLRMRHFPFAIGIAERDRWYRLMAASVHAGGLQPAEEAELLRYFASTTTFLVNQPDSP